MGKFPPTFSDFYGIKKTSLVYSVEYMGNGIKVNRMNKTGSLFEARVYYNVNKERFKRLFDEAIKNKMGFNNMKRTREEWIEVCQGITSGPVHHNNKDRLYDNAQGLRRLLEPKNLFKNGDAILEIGSGNGRFAMGICDHYRVNYTGVEIIKGCVDYCDQAFAIYDGFSFIHLDAINDRYWPIGNIDPSAVSLPFEDNSFDLVIMLSVMTHIAQPVAVNYAAEAFRVLKPNGLFFTTWFKSPPNEPSNDPARVVFSDFEIMRILSDFVVVETSGGETTSPNDQWFITSKKPNK